MKNDKRQIPLERFKKDKRQVFVDFINGLVKWKNETYKLTYVNVGGKNYPYVILKNIMPLSSLKEKIRTICNKKEELKWTEYEIYNDYYYITGIGPESIKASKNNEKEKYYRYTTEEGQRILQTLINFIGQSVL